MATITKNQTAGQKAAATKAAAKVAAPAVGEVVGPAAKPVAKVPKAVSKVSPPVKPEPALVAVSVEDSEDSQDTLGRKDVASLVRTNLKEVGIGVSESVTIQTLQAFEHVVTNALAEGKDVVLPGFGKFKVNLRPARTGRNPKSKEVMEIAASFGVAFKPGKALKDAVKARSAV